MSDTSSVGALVERARQAMMAGQWDDAALLWERVVSAAPNHPLALLHLGQHAALRGDLAGAVQLLNRALAAAPRDVATLFNLSAVHRRMGDTAAELTFLDRAIAADPYYLPALLAKGRALERSAKPRQAARIYRDALAIAPPDASLPAELQSALAHAREAVRKNAEEFESFVAQSPGILAWARKSDFPESFREARAIMAGSKKPFVQQPTLLHYPRLPAIPFYDRKQFAWLAAVEEATALVREELTDVLQEQQAEFSPYIGRPQGTQSEYAKRWTAYFLYQNGKRIEDHYARCPKTAALMEQVPLATVPGAAPAVFFSALEPKTTIPPHTGVTNTRLIVHLPLIVPEGCWFRVGNETREWKVGEALIFDDSIEHEAHNDSSELRVLLIFDIWNPYLSDMERELVCELLSNMKDYYNE